MADEPARNEIVDRSAGRSTSAGDVPEHLRRRYYLDGRGGPGVGFYVDARTPAAAFRDRGGRLVAPRNDPNAIRDMVAIAQHRGWSVVVVHGDADFRREAWLVARASGLEVQGYRPTERDRQDLERRQQARQRSRSAEPVTDRGADATMRVVRSVVRNRVADPVSQERLLAMAKARLARWLERGAEMDRIIAAREVRKPPRDRTVSR